MDEAAALRDLPAVAAVRAVRGAARSRRSRQAEARVLLRRGASSVQRRAEGAARQGRAGGAAHPLEGRRRLFRHAEPARRAARRCWRSSATACSTRLRAFTPRDQKAVRAAAETFRAEPGLRHREGDHGTRQSGEALVSTLEEQRHALDGGAHADRAAVGARRAGHAGGAQGRRPAKARCAANTTRRSIRRVAYEMLAKRKQMAEQPAQEASTSGGLGGILGKITDALGGGSQPQAQQPGKGKGRAAHVDDRGHHPLDGDFGRALGRHADHEGRAAQRARRHPRQRRRRGGGVRRTPARLRAADLDSARSGRLRRFHGRMSARSRAAGEEAALTSDCRHARLDPRIRCAGCASRHNVRRDEPGQHRDVTLQCPISTRSSPMSTRISTTRCSGCSSWLRIPSISTDPAYAKDLPPRPPNG